jgi:hypothetical protein
MPVAIVMMSLVQPLLVPRYLLWSTGPFYVLAAAGVAALPAKLVAFAAAALGLGAATSLLPYYQSETKPRWDLAAAHLAAHARAGDVTVVNSGAVRQMLAAYSTRFPIDPDILAPPAQPSQAISRFAEGARLWLIHGVTGQGVIESRETFFARWSSLGQPKAAIRIGRHIVILRFELPLHNAEDD